MKKVILVIAAAGLGSCAHNFYRTPSSEVSNQIPTDKLLSAYQVNMDIDKLVDERAILSRHVPKGANPYGRGNTNPGKIQLDNLDKSIAGKKIELKNEMDEIENLTNNFSDRYPKSLSYVYKNEFRTQKEKLVILNPENYLLQNGEIYRTFSMDLNNANHYQLGIVNKFFKLDENQIEPIDPYEQAQRRFFEASIKCDADFKMKTSFINKKIKNGENYSFRIYEQSGDDAKIILTFKNNVGSCALNFKNPDVEGKEYGVKLINDKLINNKIAELRNKVDVCLLPNNSKLEGVEKFFLTPDYQSMTCSQQIKNIKTLEIPSEGLKEKAEALLGQPLPNSFLETKNPFIDLDFSKAPKLNTIFISYLVFRADFYGNLIARLVKWHADHGVDVRILVSDVITLKKDHQMLYNLAESSNHIKLQEFKYDSQGGMGLWDHLSELHRTMHVKLLITLSDIPENNVVFFGGRNIHDGFVFKELPDHSKIPELVQYGTGKGKDESYTHWRDFEMKVISKELAEKVSSHLLTLFEKDSKTMFVRSINQNIKLNQDADLSYFSNRTGPLVRHFMSIPYRDEHALEKFYADMVDSAQKTIRLSTPYFRPTKLIGEALERAVKRGVDVSLITRIDLSGDTAAIILGEVNKAGINQFLNKIKIYEYTEPNVILHSKLCLIDGKYSFIGSVNLNKRSFVHDTENGIMIYDQDFNQRMNSIMDTYKITSREVTEKQKIALWKRAVIGIFDEEF